MTTTPTRLLDLRLVFTPGWPKILQVRTLHYDPIRLRWTEEWVDVPSVTVTLAEYLNHSPPKES